MDGEMPTWPLIVSRNKKRITRQQIWKIIKGARHGIQITVSPHTFRHTFATNLYQKSKDIRLVQKALGHRSIQTTQIYADVSREDMKKAMEEL